MADKQLKAHLAAHQSLERARSDLDDVVRTLPEHDGDNAMATPALLDALLRAVAARRHLNEVETDHRVLDLRRQ